MGGKIVLAIREMRMRLPRYLVVGATCAILNNILLIALAHMGFNFVAASVLAFWPVLAAGYVLHTFFTFGTSASISSLLRYTLSMATNFPAGLLCLFVFCDLAKLHMAIAAPTTTLLMFAWNYLAVRWSLKPAMPT